MPDVDEVTQQAQDVYTWLAEHPFPEHAPDLSFIFQLMGITLGTPRSRDVYRRLLDRLALEREYRERTKGLPADQ
jgi:hypothetical protein